MLKKLWKATVFIAEIIASMDDGGANGTPQQQINYHTNNGKYVVYQEEFCCYTGDEEIKIINVYDTHREARINRSAGQKIAEPSIWLH